MCLCASAISRRKKFDEKNLKLNHGKPGCKFTIVCLIEVSLGRFLNAIKEELILKTIDFIICLECCQRAKLTSGGTNIWV